MTSTLEVARAYETTTETNLTSYPLVPEPPNDQAWFWTEEWQASVQRSLEQAERGEGDVLGEDQFLGELDGE